MPSGAISWNTWRPSLVGVSSVSKRSRSAGMSGGAFCCNRLGAPTSICCVRHNGRTTMLAFSRRLRAHAQRDIDRILEQIDDAVRHAHHHAHFRDSDA